MKSSYNDFQKKAITCVYTCLKIWLVLSNLLLLSACSTKKHLVNAAHKVPRQRIIPKDLLTSSYTPATYINRYQGIAVREMRRYGIPASITLAQGLLESSSGNSALAQIANNHFGIKCGNEWRGQAVLQEDDQKNDCFRVYESAEESFRDHSAFLQRKRYSPLFTLKRDDYRGWAYGLKIAGYATNPHYPELLTNLIERYHLDQYDRDESEEARIEREEKILAEIMEKGAKQAIEKTPVTMKVYEVKLGDTFDGISKRFGLSIEDLKLLNDLSSDELKIGELLVVSK